MSSIDPAAILVRVAALCAELDQGVIYVGWLPPAPSSAPSLYMQVRTDDLAQEIATRLGAPALQRRWQGEEWLRVEAVHEGLHVTVTGPHRPAVADSGLDRSSHPGGGLVIESDATPDQAAPMSRPELTARGLTAREREVAERLALGDTNREIARRLGVSVKTIDTHRGHVMKKLGLRHNVDLARDALRRGYVTLDDGGA